MIINWTVELETDFPDEEIDAIVDDAIAKNWDESQIRAAIFNVVIGFDDEFYFTWGEKQTDEVYKEVMQWINKRKS